MIEKYRLIISDKTQFEQEKNAAFEKFRKIIQPWRSVIPNCHVALGGDSDSGEWSVVFEDGFWLVFVGERGKRFQLCFFTNVWDAVSFAGFVATSGVLIDKTFPLLRPPI